MSNRRVPNELLGVVKKTTGKSLQEADIVRLAQGVKPGTLTNEEQLRALIRQVAGLVQVPVSEATMRELVQTVQGSQLQLDQLEPLLRMMLKK